MQKSIVLLVITAVVLIGMIVYFVWHSKHTEYAPLDPVTVFVATDLHYLSPELTDHGAYFQQMIRGSDGKAMEYCEELTNAFVEQVIVQRPDALILSGDLTFNGAQLSHTALAEKLLLIKNEGIPVLVLPGNHDLENPMAASFYGDGFTLVDSINARQFEKIYQAFGLGDAIARDPSSLSYIAELAPGLRVLMVDVNTVDSPGVLTDSTLQWVERQLREAERQGSRVLAVSHQNLLKHNNIFSYGFVMENSAALLALYEKYNVICNLSGHMHIQHITHSENGLPEIASSSLIVSPNQYGVLTLNGTTASYDTARVNVSLLTGKDSDSDNVLMDFSDYARTSLWDTAYRQAEAELDDAPEPEQMCAFFADVNTAYISGRMDTISWDDVLYQMWEDQHTFMASYLQSIFDDGFRNYKAHSFSFH